MKTSPVHFFILQGAMAFLLLLFCSFTIPESNGLNMVNYHRYFAAGTYQGKELLVIRKFESSGNLHYLALDPANLETRIIAAKDMRVKTLNWPEVLAEYKESPYVKAIQTVAKQPDRLQNEGIEHGAPGEKGVTLTIDLCPSHKPLDRIIFTSLIAEFQKIEKPVPVALSVTGRFMLSHSEDMNWLKGLVQSGDLSITWINHSYNHHFNPKAPLKTNFLLEPGTDLNFEILGTELAMLQKGLLPSVFFRFPGLVSDEQVTEQVIAYGLIPVGSDAWLAKGQPAHTGSIVLIHGNGNEPVGVQDFIRLLQTQQTAVTGRQWIMYDLRESVEDEFGQ